MPKNILIFSDGTGQEGGRAYNTNIYKLFNMVEDRTPEQIAFYDRGVGTSKMRLISGMAGGRGFARNVRECYEFIFDNYQSGDKLFLFGFSRGAATVRSLAYFIHLFGILPHSRPELIPKAWRIYQDTNREDREKRAREFIRRHHTMWTTVHFVGVYDTVAALGLPFRAGSVILDGLRGFRHRFHSFDLSPSVEHAYHALAIDDERLTFHPLVWEPIEESRKTCDGSMACKELRQVWFMGMHTDVGGGYPEQQLSDIPLVWLTQMAVEKGLRIYHKYDVDILEDANGHMHDSRGTIVTKLYRRKLRGWDIAKHGKPVIHESVLQRTKDRRNGDGAYKPWILESEYEIEPWVRYDAQPWHQAKHTAASSST